MDDTHAAPAAAIPALPSVPDYPHSLEALALDAPLPWRVDGSATDLALVRVRDAEGGYVCEIDTSEFTGPPPEREDTAHGIARLIAAAVNAEAPAVNPAAPAANPVGTPAPHTITEQVDALIAVERRPLDGPAAELAMLCRSMGDLAAFAAMVGAAPMPGRPAAAAFAERIGVSLLHVLRLARAAGLRIEDAVAEEVARRTRAQEMFARQQARTGAALDRARQAGG